MFTENELVLLSDLVGQYLEIEDLSQREFGEAKFLLEKVDNQLENLKGALDPHDKFFR
jgi:hypothetical protein